MNKRNIKMKKYVFLLVVLFFAPLCYAVDFPPDSNHVWHVSVDGNDDDNTGHAGQYPIDLEADAYLTIGQAVSDACDGDTIIVWPGTYDEKNDGSGLAGITLMGTGWNCVLSNSSADYVLKVGSNWSLENLKVINTNTMDTARHAVEISSKTNCRIKGCWLESKGKTLDTLNADNLWVEDCYIKGSEYGGGLLNTSANIKTILKNSIFITDGLWTSCANVSLMIFGGEAIVENCILHSVLTAVDANSAHYPVGFYVDGTFSAANVVVRGCTIKSSKSSGDYAYGIKASGTNTARVLAQNCIITGGTTGDYNFDLITATEGYITVAGCDYDTTKTSGNNITQGGAGWADQIHKHSKGGRYD